MVLFLMAIQAIQRMSSVSYTHLQLHTDGTLISANTLVMNAKESIQNEGVIQGKTVILATDKDIINSGHINAEKVGLQSDRTIYQQGQVVGRDAVELQAKENITVNNSIEHLTKDVYKRQILELVLCMIIKFINYLYEFIFKIILYFTKKL